MGRQFRTTERGRPATPVANWVQTYPSFEPLDLANCAVWFDAADLSTITESGGSVSQWNDKSGNGRNASQGTASIQPATGVNTQNGLNVLTFETTLKRLDTATFTVPNGPFSSYVVFRPSSNSQMFFFEQSGDNNGRRFHWYSNTNARFVFGYRDNVTFRDYFRSWTYATTANIVWGVCDGGNVFTGVSASLETMTTRTGFPVSAARFFRIGLSAAGGFPLRGDLMEMIVYDAEHSFQERQLILSYLQNKWRAVL